MNAAGLGRIDLKDRNMARTSPGARTLTRILDPNAPKPERSRAAGPRNREDRRLEH